MVEPPMKLIAFVMIVTAFQFVFVGGEMIESIPNPPSLATPTFESQDPEGFIEETFPFFTSLFEQGIGLVNFLLELIIYPFKLLPFVIKVAFLDFVEGLPIWIVVPIGVINFVGIIWPIANIVIRVVEGSGSVT